MTRMIEVSEELASRVEERARAQGLSLAQFIQESLERTLSAPPGVTEQTKRDPLFMIEDLIVDDSAEGVTDFSENKNKHLDESMQEEVRRWQQR